MLYRVHSNILTSCDISYPSGTLSTLDGISQKGINKLLERGVITEARLPPLIVIIQDKKLVGKLYQHDVKDAEQLLSADLKELSGKLSIAESVLLSVVSKVQRYVNPVSVKLRR